MKILKSLLIAALLLNCGSSIAQITIVSNDLANTNDTIRISVNTSLNGFVPGATGTNYLWDYSFLVPDSHRVTKCTSPGTTPYAIPYSFLASYGIYNNTPDQFPFVLFGAPPTDVYDFYKKTPNSLSIMGQGMNVMGTGIPAVYSNPDRIYKFPMNYQDIDSTTSGFGFPVPGFGYYSKKQKRVNEVDGWGTLKTPYGTFNTIRVKSTLTITDSIYLDTIGFGFSIPRPLQYEFKWLANGKKLALLEVDATANANGLIIDRVNWRDSMLSPLSVNLVGPGSCVNVPEGTLTAAISGGRNPMHYQWSTGDTTQTISNLYPGLYTVTVTDLFGSVFSITDSVKVRTDSTCLMQISIASDSSCAMTRDGSLSASLSNGRSPLTYVWSTGETTDT